MYCFDVKCSTNISDLCKNYPQVCHKDPKGILENQSKEVKYWQIRWGSYFITSCCTHCLFISSSSLNFYLRLCNLRLCKLKLLEYILKNTLRKAFFDTRKKQIWLGQTLSLLSRCNQWNQESKYNFVQLLDLSNNAILVQVECESLWQVIPRNKDTFEFSEEIYLGQAPSVLSTSAIAQHGAISEIRKRTNT